MNLTLIREELKQLLNPSRFRHSIGVEEVSHDLALIHGYDTDKAQITGILHDCARYLKDEELLETCERYHLQVRDIERECEYLLHAKVGAIIAKVKYGVEDKEILDAIIYHTTGRPAMTLLEKIIFTADYIEPYRNPLPRIDLIRKAAYNDLDWAVCMILENTLNYLRESNKKIDAITVATYEYYQKLLHI